MCKTQSIQIPKYKKVFIALIVLIKFWVEMSFLSSPRMNCVTQKSHCVRIMKKWREREYFQEKKVLTKCWRRKKTHFGRGENWKRLFSLYKNVWMWSFRKLFKVFIFWNKIEKCTFAISDTHFQLPYALSISILFPILSYDIVHSQMIIFESLLGF